MSLPLRTAVVGTGHLGSAHARILSSLPGAELVAVCDMRREAADKAARESHAEVFTDYRAMPEDLDAVVVAVPTSSHLEVARFFLERGSAVLVEKPMASDSTQARELLDVSRANDALLQVGHVERFNPAVVAALEKIDVPRFIEARRVAPFAFRSVDIGVVLDLMIHDIDIILHMVGARVKELRASGVAVLSKSEDIANVRIEFEDGCVMDATASRVATKSERMLRVFQQSSYLSINLLGKSVRLLRLSEKVLSGDFDVSRIDPATLKDPEAFLFKELIKVEELCVEDKEPLRSELEHFIAAASGKTPCIVPGEHGLRAMEVAETIVSALGGDGRG